MTAKTDMLPDFVFNHLTRLARIGSQIVCDAENVVQTVDGEGNLFVTLTIPVSRVAIEDDPTGPVNHARPHFTVRP